MNNEAELIGDIQGEAKPNPKTRNGIAINADDKLTRTETPNASFHFFQNKKKTNASDAKIKPDTRIK